MTEPKANEQAKDLFDSYRRLGLWSEEVIRRLAVTILGCGTLGSYLAESLAAMGVGTIVLLDDDKVEEHNRLRMAQVIPEDLGRPKVAAVADGLRRRFGDLVWVVPLEGSAQTMLGSGLARRSAAIFLCADNRAARQYGCRVARTVQTPHISGTIDRFFGMVSGVFDPPVSACYECTLSEQERESLLQARFSCAPPAERAPSVPTTPIAASITAAWMTLLLLQYAHGERDSLLAQRIFINPLRSAGAVQVAQFNRRANCTCSGESRLQEIITLDTSREDLTPRILLSEVKNIAGEDAWVVLDYTLVTAEVCRKCGFRQTLDPPRHEATPSFCPNCNDSQMSPTALMSIINKEHPLADYTFSELRLPLLHAVAVGTAELIKVFELRGDARRLGLL